MRWLFVVPALVGFSQVASAQIVVHVVSEGGAPVPSAEVVAWDRVGRVGTARTDAMGVARLTSPRERLGEGFITVRRIGYARARVVLPDTGAVTISLLPVAAPLPMLAVTTRVLRCPATTEESAERLWRSAAVRYGSDVTSLYLGYRGAWAQDRVSAEQRGFGDTPARQRIGVATPAAFLVRGRPAPLRYASYEKVRNASGLEYDHWRYATLHGHAAGHFATQEFLARHTLVVLGESEASTIVGFCPKSDDDAEIEGELEIGRDSLFQGARWRFRVGHDDEDAGGEATFSVGFEGNDRYIVAVRGTSWRRTNDGTYEQERFSLLAWQLGRTAESVNLKWNSRGDPNARSTTSPIQ